MARYVVPACIDAHAFDLDFSPETAGDGGGPDDARRRPTTLDLTATMLTRFHPCKPLVRRPRVSKNLTEAHHAAR